MDTHLIVRLLNYMTPRCFRACRLLSRKWNEASKMANVQWLALLGDIAPRKITRASAHLGGYYSRCAVFADGGNCTAVAHYRRATLELKLLKTVPLYEQAMRILCRRHHKEARREVRRQRFNADYHEMALANAMGDYMSAVNDERYLAEQLERFNSGKRKRKRLDHSINT